MVNSPADPGPLTTPPDLSSFSQWVRNAFVGPNGVRAAWRFLMFVALAFVFFIGFGTLLALLQPQRFQRPAGPFIMSPRSTITQEVILLGAVFLAAFIMSQMEKRSFWSYGMPLRGAFGKLFWQGVLFGLVLESVEILLIAAFRGFSLSGLALAGETAAKYAVLWAVSFILVGIFEEFTFRGYAQYTLTTGMGFWPAAITTSMLFGALHLGNPGEAWVGALSVVMVGLFLCFTLKRTGSLWFAIGFHAAVDYAETFIYSVPDSGVPASGHLLNSSLHGARWLTGGDIGPEGSVFVFVVLGLAFPVMAWLYPRKEQPSGGVAMPYSGTATGRPNDSTPVF
jgi:uncharacterized protein